MEITRDTPINFITFNANIDKRNLYNNPLARMCMDSWKRAFPNLNIINIDVTEEIANMNEFSKFAYNQNLKSYTTDPLRLYYVNQYDNCVYCDYDVILYDFNSIVDLMNNNNEFILFNTGTFTWNKYKNNLIITNYYKRYNNISKSLNEKYTAFFKNYIDGCDFMIKNSYSDYQLDFSSIKTYYLKNLIFHISWLYKLYNKNIFFNIKNNEIMYFWYIYIKYPTLQIEPILTNKIFNIWICP